MGFHDPYRTPLPRLARVLMLVSLLLLVAVRRARHPLLLERDMDVRWVSRSSEPSKGLTHAFTCPLSTVHSACLQSQVGGDLRALSGSVCPALGPPWSLLLLPDSAPAPSQPPLACLAAIHSQLLGLLVPVLGLSFSLVPVESSLGFRLVLSRLSSLLKLVYVCDQLATCRNRRALMRRTRNKRTCASVAPAVSVLPSTSSPKLLLYFCNPLTKEIIRC